MSKSSDLVIAWLDRLIKILVGYMIVVLTAVMFVWALNVIIPLFNKEWNTRRNTLCHEGFICTKYRDVRQQCAIAGDFNNCVNVKMGSEPTYRLICTNDGELISSVEKADMPSEIECLLRTVGSER